MMNELETGTEYLPFPWETSMIQVQLSELG